jgi:hypothetical protein
MVCGINAAMEWQLYTLWRQYMPDTMGIFIRHFLIAKNTNSRQASSFYSTLGKSAGHQLR